MPFVDLNLTDAPQSRVPWQALGKLAYEAYRVFEPRKLRRLRWLTDNDASAAPGWTMDQVLLAAPLGELETDAHTTSDASFRELTLPEVERIAARISKVYEAWFSAEPWMRGFVRPQTETSLRESVESGVAVVMAHHGQIHGLISCNSKPSFRTGCPGLCVQEKVVSFEFAGSGLSRVLHSELVKCARRRFPASKLLYGTIDARNVRSLANARRAGRKPIGVLEFMSLVE